MNKRITRVSPAAVGLFDRYQWPGNIRELENAIERAMVVAQEPELRESDFALRLPIAGGTSRTLEDMEKVHILAVLEECRGNQRWPPNFYDIDRVTLHNNLRNTDGRELPRKLCESHSTTAARFDTAAGTFRPRGWYHCGCRHPCEILTPEPDPAFAFNVTRQQYSSTEILAAIVKRSTPNGGRLSRSPPSICTFRSSPLFGEAQLHGHAAIVSYFPPAPGILRIAGRRKDSRSAASERIHPRTRTHSHSSAL